MYAEERPGRNINSAGIMWEIIEEVFQGIRTVMMSKSGRARSGSFNLMWSSALLSFWEVRDYYTLSLTPNKALNSNRNAYSMFRA